MQVGQFPASAANSLIEGYCDDFVSLAAILAQTLEQISIRGISIDRSKASLARIENGMRNLAEAIHELVERGKVTTALGPVIQKDEVIAPPPQAAPPATTAAPAAAIAPAAPPRPTPAPAPIANRPQGRAASTPARNTPTPPAPTPIRTPAPGPTPPPTAAAVKPPTRAASGSLKGQTKDMPLLTVFQMLAKSQKLGTLHVCLAQEQLAFDLAKGTITSASSDQCPHEERLGELLIELGHCTREQIDEVAQKAAGGGFDRFGEVAVELGHVRAEQVADALREQVRRRFIRACKAAAATYEFTEGACMAAASIFRFPPVPIA
jgi:hypothetical protein